MRIVAGLFLGGLSAIFGWSLVAGLSGSWILGAMAAVAAGAAVAWLAARGSLVALDRTAIPKALLVVAAIATIAAIVQIGRLTVFMADSSKSEYSFLPQSAWETRHSCVTAYFVAARAASSTSSVYADSLYTSPDDDPTKVRKALTIGRFGIDVYEYPPTFLLLPRLLRHAAPDFDRFRLLWFGLEGIVVLLAIVVIARFLGGGAGTRALFWAPLVLAATPTLSTMQKGNVQHVVIALSMLAMVLLQRRKWAAGGALLAYATASKLYPGLLVIYLIARREWRAVWWTVGSGLALIAVTIMDMGAGAHAAFMEHLPGLMSGEAFPAFRNPAGVAINYSIPGIGFKLKLFGVEGYSFAASKIVGWIYTVIAVGVTIWAARRAGPSRGHHALLWLAVLILATLRSPFLPQAYAAFPPVWLLTLLAAIAAPVARTLALTLLGWAALSIYWPMDQGLDPRSLALLILVPQTVTIVVTILALRRSVPAVK